MDARPPMLRGTKLEPNLDSTRDAAILSGDDRAISKLIAKLAGRADRIDHRRFIYETLVLAVAFGRTKAAVSWIASWRRGIAPLDSDRLETAVADLAFVEVCELVLSVGRRGRSVERERYAAIPWESLGSDDWIENIRISFLLHADELARALEHLEQTARSPRAIDLGYRCALLAAWAERRGDAEGFELFYERAIALFAEDASLLSRVRRVNLEAHRGALEVERGNYHVAEESFERMIRFHEETGSRSIFWDAAITLADCRIRRGMIEAAESVLRRTLPSAAFRKAPTPQQFQLHRIFAELALAKDRRSVACRHIAAAEALFARFPHSRLQAEILSVRARIEASKGTSAAHERALRTIDESDALFRRAPGIGLQGICGNIVLRGELHLRREDAVSALACCLEALRVGRQQSFLPVQARALVLKSYLLLSTDATVAERIYEEILHDLGLVKDPALLFEVISNLYLHTWKLDGSNLELTDLHLKQIHRLRRFLEPTQFQDLYIRLVVERLSRSVKSSRSGD
jgi:tetratricopeptide (TPR) repeat protein